MWFKCYNSIVLIIKKRHLPNHNVNSLAMSSQELTLTLRVRLETIQKVNMDEGPKAWEDTACSLYSHLF